MKRYFFLPLFLYAIIASFVGPNVRFNKKFYEAPPLHLTNNKYEWGPGEYVNAFVNLQTHALYQMIDIPLHFTNLGDIWAKTVSGAHHAIALSLDGRVAGWGDNSNGQLGLGNTNSQSVPVFATNDSLGVPFNNIVDIQAGGTIGWNDFALRGNGTVWGVGDLSAGTRGNGTYGGQTTKWVQIPFPAGVFIVSISCSFNCIALDSQGNIWTWGGKGYFGGFGEAYLMAQGTSSPNCFSPTKIPMPTGVTAKMISGGGGWIGYFLGSDSHLYGWGLDLRYAGIANTSIDLSQNSYKAMDLTSFLNLPAPIDTLIENSMYTLTLLQTGALYAWGSNATGCSGVGPGINYDTYATPWAWDQGRGEAMITTPTRIFPGKSNFRQIFANTSLTFYFNAEDANDSMYGWGRNKGGVLGDLIEGVDTSAEDLRSLYPNNWDCNWGKFIDPFRRNYTINTTAQYFKTHPTATLGSKYPIKAGTTTTASAGPNQSITTSWTVLRGSAIWSFSTARGIWRNHWSVVSIPTGAPPPDITFVENDSTPVSNLVTGSYVFRNREENNWFVADSTTVTITVSLNGNIIPTVNAGFDQSITLPTNSVTLSGSATGNGGASIVSTSWSKFNGPAGGTITNNTALSTTVTGLVQGQYTFRLTAVDNNGSNNTDDVLITVLPAAVLPPSGQRGYYIRTRRTTYN